MKGKLCIIALTLTALLAIDAPGALPEGYVRRESITSDAKAYIDIGVSPAANTIVDMYFKLATVSGDKKFFGYYAPGVAVGTISDCWRLGCNWGNQTHAASTEDTHLRVHVQTSSYQNGAYFIDDMEHPLFTSQATAGSGTYAVFGVNYTTGKGLQKDVMTLYSLTIRDASTDALVVNLVPATHGDEIGLYDTVRGIFLTNANTQGSFTAGDIWGPPIAVAGSPDEFGVSAPAYGSSKTFVSEVSYSLSGGTAVDGFSGTYYFTSDSRSFAAFSNATYAPEGGSSETVSDASFTRTATEDGVSLTWNFTDVHHLLTASAPTGSAVRLGDGERHDLRQRQFLRVQSGRRLGGKRVAFGVPARRHGVGDCERRQRPGRRRTHCGVVLPVAGRDAEGELRRGGRNAQGRLPDRARGGNGPFRRAHAPRHGPLRPLIAARVDAP